MKKITKILLCIISFFALCWITFFIRYFVNENKLYLTTNNENNIFWVDYVTVIEEDYPDWSRAHPNFFDYLSWNWIKFKTSFTCMWDYCKWLHEIVWVWTWTLTDNDIDIAINLIWRSEKDYNSARVALIKSNLITEEKKKIIEDLWNISVQDIEDWDIVEVYMKKN